MDAPPSRCIEPRRPSFRPSNYHEVGGPETPCSPRDSPGCFLWEKTGCLPGEGEKSVTGRLTFIFTTAGAGGFLWRTSTLLRLPWAPAFTAAGETRAEPSFAGRTNKNDSTSALTTDRGNGRLSARSKCPTRR